jgi:endonuclease/exonuclease/phosphatase family metal-dependent hydrolase
VADGLVDTAVATGNEAAPTFPSSAPRTRIDAVFVDPRFTVDEYQVIDTPQARTASDHLPVVVDVTLAAR